MNNADDSLTQLRLKRALGRWITLPLCLLGVAILVLCGRPAATEALVPTPGIPPTGHTVAPARITAATLTTPTVYLPLVQTSSSFVNIQDRQASLDFYLAQYLSFGALADWTGDHATCTAGSTGQDFRDDVLRRINYFRAMAGLPLVTLDDEYNRKAQAAALMMSANRKLSHSPTSDWTCYSSDGAQGAGSSNLYLGVYGWNAISGYIRDPGSGNYAAGHRRWILYPQTQAMGTGDIPSSSYPASNALWVFDSHIWEERPETRDEFVAWPPPGYVPYQVVFARWSFAYPQADFLSATVAMTSGGGSVPVVVSPVVTGYGENTLVWIPNGLSDYDSWPKPQVDTTYTVSVQNVVIGGQNRSFTYDVVVFDPTP